MQQAEEIVRMAESLGQVRGVRIIPNWLRNERVGLAAFQNLEFYRAQGMRLPTCSKPRIVACAEDHGSHLAMPSRHCGQAAATWCIDKRYRF